MLFFVENGLIRREPAVHIPNYAIGQVVYTFRWVQDNLRFVKNEKTTVKLCYSIKPKTS